MSPRLDRCKRGHDLGAWRIIRAGRSRGCLLCNRITTAQAIARRNSQSAPRRRRAPIDPAEPMLPSASLRAIIAGRGLHHDDACELFMARHGGTMRTASRCWSALAEPEIPCLVADEWCAALGLPLAYVYADWSESA